MVMKEETFDNFNFSDEVLDEIQQNIQNIIENFDVPEDNKLDVIRKINFMYTKTKELSITDALTGLFNRRHFENTADREFLRAVRYKNDLTFAIVDIDFFKHINDTYGHLCGDKILKEVAFLLNDSFRKTDIVFRYGGEEFVILLPETTKQGAGIIAERLRKNIANLIRVNTNDDRIVTTTVSMGISQFPNDAATGKELIEAADKALYYSKRNGKNVVSIYEEGDRYTMVDKFQVQ